MKNLMMKCDYYHKKAVKTNKEVYWSNYRRLRNALTGKLQKEKSTYYSTKLAGKQHSKQMWKTLKDILPKKTKSIHTRYLDLTAVQFNQYFTQIASTFWKFCIAINFDSQSSPKHHLT